MQDWAADSTMYVSEKNGLGLVMSNRRGNLPKFEQLRPAYLFAQVHV